MMPLFDMLMRAQNGQAMNDMAARFGLDLDEMNKVTQALMPAFSTGFKRNAASPDAFNQLMQNLASGDYAQYFENATKAFSPAGISDGNLALGQIFGSKDISRAIAAQTEAFTGVGQEIVKQMLPVYASTIMGGMFAQANQAIIDMMGGSKPTNSMPPNMGMNAFFDMMNQMMGQPKKQEVNPFVQMMNNHPMMKMMNFEPEKKATNIPLDNPMADMMQLMFDNMRQAQDAAHKSFEDMLKSTSNASELKTKPETTPFDDNNLETSDDTAQDTEAEPQPDSKPKAQHASENVSGAMTEIFDKMFETGMAVQDEYRKNVEQVFDQVLANMDKK